MRTLLLHNPTAGASHPNADELMRQLKAAGFRPKYQSSKDGYRQTLRKRWDLVIVAGGDGTVARVARRLRNREIPLAILPIGTANNIARALGLNGDIDSLISHLPTAQAQAPRYRRCAWAVGQASVPRGGRLRHDCQGHCA